MPGMDLSPTEIVGYGASLLILLSITRTSILQLRVTGLVGSAAFVVYGLLIGAYPIAIVNVAIVGVHVFFLRELLSKKREFFTSLELNADSRYLRHFLDFYRDDIEAHQPEFRFHPRTDQVRAFVLRDLVPAGLFVGRLCADNSIEVELDYVVPQYRDFKVAEFLYSDRSQVFHQGERRRIWTRPGNDSHRQYFQRLGFTVAEVDDRPALVADLDSVLDTQ